MANTLSVMTNAIRNVVSRQRIRYKENGFNLDLTYIRDNIIAMGYPADRLEGFYRNRLEDVFKFLEENHQDHYKIYNLCLERSYDVNKFHGRVAIYPFEDHNPPTIELIQRFCDDVDAWLKLDNLNVAAVHCKAGKGRTGTMICCYLLYSGFQTTAEDALAWYDEKRTKDRKGVTIPSQRRYVQYFSKLINLNLSYEKRSLRFCEIRFDEAGLLHNYGIVNCSVSVLQDSQTQKMNVQRLKNSTIDFNKSFVLDLCNSFFIVAGDIKVELTQKSSRRNLFHFWFNTYFVPSSADREGEGNETKLIYTLSKSEIDDVHKDKEHKQFSEDFKVRLVFCEESPFDIDQQRVLKNTGIEELDVSNGCSHSEANLNIENKITSSEPNLYRDLGQINGGYSKNKRVEITSLQYKTEDNYNKNDNKNCDQPPEHQQNLFFTDSSKNLMLKWEGSSTSNSNLFEASYKKNETQKPILLNQMPSELSPCSTNRKDESTYKCMSEKLNFRDSKSKNCVGPTSSYAEDVPSCITDGIEEEKWESAEFSAKLQAPKVKQQSDVVSSYRLPSQVFNTFLTPTETLNITKNTNPRNNKKDDKKDMQDYSIHFRKTNNLIKTPNIFGNATKFIKAKGDCSQSRNSEVSETSTYNGTKIANSKHAFKTKLKTNKFKLTQKLQWFKKYFRSDPTDFCQNFVQHTITRNNSTCSLAERSTMLMNSVRSDTDTYETIIRPAIISAMSSSYPTYSKKNYLMEALSNKSKSYTFFAHSYVTKYKNLSEDFYSSICDKKLSFSNSPCKSPGYYICNSQDKQVLIQSRREHKDNLSNRFCNVVIVAGQVKQESIGFNVDSKAINGRFMLDQDSRKHENVSGSINKFNNQLSQISHDRTSFNFENVNKQLHSIENKKYSGNYQNNTISFSNMDPAKETINLSTILNCTDSSSTYLKQPNESSKLVINQKSSENIGCDKVGLILNKMETQTDMQRLPALTIETHPQFTTSSLYATRFIENE